MSKSYSEIFNVLSIDEFATPLSSNPRTGNYAKKKVPDKNVILKITLSHL